MYKIKYFSETQDVQSKKIILRLDLNVPLNEKIIQDKSRIFALFAFFEKFNSKKGKNYNYKSFR